MGKSPYSDLPEKAFWRKAVAEKGLFNYQDLWRSKWQLPEDARFSTYGSCFAQHISRALIRHEMNWVNAEPRPGEVSDALAKRFNYDVFSSRTANIYTARQLLAWCRLAEDETRVEQSEIWENEGRFRDCLRPAIEPDGFETEAECRASLRSTARAFGRSIRDADVFVFTMGLTEGWENGETGATYAVCPGTLGGTFDAETHVFCNYEYPGIMADLTEAIDIMRRLKPGLNVLLTVSPVPLVATASDAHVLVATQYSKSVLRAVAGAMANANEHIDYFPSYEIIASPPTRAAFFEPDMRSVAMTGVDLVMSHFFAGLNLTTQTRARPDTDAARAARLRREIEAEELVCEELALEGGRDDQA